MIIKYLGAESYDEFGDTGLRILWQPGQVSRIENAARFAILSALTDFYSVFSFGPNVTLTSTLDGYRDLKPTGEYTPGGAADPTVKTFVGNMLAPAFAGSGANNMATYRFHFNHDLVIGADFYFHVHWANITGSPTGDVKWKVTWRYARGYELGAFDTDIVTTIPDATVNGTTYQHHISESAAVTPAIVGESVQIDGVIIACLERDTTDTNNDDAFLLEFDIHYKSDRNTTVEKNESGSGFTKS